MICNKCGSEIVGQPAISRIDESLICPLCGTREALETSVKNGNMTRESAEEIINIVKEKNLEHELKRRR
jgi:ribosome-binding protein aMBF1 (putative translation factor)